MIRSRRAGRAHPISLIALAVLCAIALARPLKGLAQPSAPPPPESPQVPDSSATPEASSRPPNQWPTPVPLSTPGNQTTPEATATPEARPTPEATQAVCSPVDATLARLRSETGFTPAYVSVRGADGKPIENLSQDDFTVLIDG